MSINVWQKQGVVIAPVAADTPGQPNVLYESGAKILVGTVCKMWFGTANGICYAESLTGLPSSWTRYLANPLIPLAQGFPRLFKHPTTGVYYLYTCVLTTDKMVSWTSPAGDGLTFTMQNADALGALQSWEQPGTFIGQLAVLDIIGGVWYGYYTSFSTSGDYKIGLATSSDGLTWVKSASNPITDFGEASNLSFQKVGSVYYGWTQIVQAGIPAYGSDSIPSDISRFWATSPTGPWTGLPVSTLYRTYDYEGVGSVIGQVADPCLLAVGADIEQYFTVNDVGTGNTGYQIALATAPSKTFAQLVATYEGVKDVPFPSNTGLALNLLTSASDNFTRADATPPSASWSTFDGYPDLALVSDTVRSSVIAGGGAANYYNGITWSPDQWVQLKVLACLNNSDVGLLLRASASAQTAYYVFWNGAAGSPGSLYVAKYVAGSYTQIAKIDAITISVNDILTASVIGTTISVYQNGNLLTIQTDSDIASGNGGIFLYAATALTDSIVGNWSGGASQSAPTPPGPPSGGGVNGLGLLRLLGVN